MGLDAVELVMEVEDHFDIPLGEAEWQSVRTVGDLVALIHNRVRLAHEQPCLTLYFFMRLRQCVRDVTGNARLRIRPRDSVAGYLSRSERRLLWQRLEGILGYSPTALQRPRWLRWLLVFLAIGLLLAACIYAMSINVILVPLMLAIAVLGIVFLNRITVPLRTEPPDNWSTFGEVTMSMVGPVAATRHLDLRTADEILAELRPIVAKTLGVDLAKVAPTTRFVEDLGMG